MFTKESFAIFEVAGLEERMTRIRENIQPEFQKIGEHVIESLKESLAEELQLHIAQHRRRTAYAPESTWCAFGGDKRGYKKYPHFELTINDQGIGMWLSFIDNPQFEKEIAAAFLAQQNLFNDLSPDFVLSPDHTKATFYPLNTKNLTDVLTRWHTVKKGECMVGRVLAKNDPLLNHPEAATTFIIATYQALVPLYKLAYQVREEALKSNDVSS